MHEIVAELTEAFGVQTAILPVTNERVATHLLTEDGEVAFQDYMVRLATEPDVTGMRFAGADESTPPPASSTPSASRTGSSSPPVIPLSASDPSSPSPACARPSPRAAPAASPSARSLVGGRSRARRRRCSPASDTMSPPGASPPSTATSSTSWLSTNRIAPRPPGRGPRPHLRYHRHDDDQSRTQSRAGVLPPGPLTLWPPERGASSAPTLLLLRVSHAGG